MCVFIISPVPTAEPITSEFIDTPVFNNLAPRPIKYRVSVPIPTAYTHLANTFLYKLSIEKQRSVVDARGLDLQNDI